MTTQEDRAPGGVSEPIARRTRPGAGDPRHIVFVAWRDLANANAGGSEILVDRLAQGMAARGDRITLLCGGQVGDRPYRVIRSGGTYTQFLRAPARFHRLLGDSDLVVEVCNGMPFLAPLWTKRPVVCLVNHVHTQLWPVRFRRPVSDAGQFLESAVMPRVHRHNLFLTVSPSTRDALVAMGVGAERIRVISTGVEPAPAPGLRSPDPLFMALGRLADYKRMDLLLRLWERVRPLTGGTLLIVGDGPEAGRLRAMAGESVRFTGRVCEEEKHRLLSAAWILLHPAMIEGWGIVVSEAALRSTPAIGFAVPGLKDSVKHGQTGLLVDTDAEFAQAWVTLAHDHQTRQAMGLAARKRAVGLHWSSAVDAFADVAREALAQAGNHGGVVAGARERSEPSVPARATDT